MKNQKFLLDVAQYFIDKPELQASSVMVFPNKRAAIFFRYYLRRLVKDVTLLPEAITIGAFEARYYTQAELSDDHIQLVMVLYTAYRSVCLRHEQAPMTFDRFAFWGEMMLSDFDQIDRSLVDADALYINLKRYNEISSNFLTPEQLEVVREIWGDDRASMMGAGVDTDRFWKHLSDACHDEAESGDGARRYMRLWEMTAEIYAEYNRRLDSLGIAYPGLVERRVSDIVSNDTGSIPGRIVFVGFNRLSIAQARMFKALQSHDKALFFWDLLPDSDVAPYAARAGAMVRRLSRIFPMPADFVPSPHNSCPDITVYSVPGNFMQAKQVGSVLNGWCADRTLNYCFPDNTAIILPDQNLLPPLLHSIPAALNEDTGDGDDGQKRRPRINITMGLSYRQTPFATLLRVIIGMHLKRRVINGQVFFFRDDILQVINNPHLRTIDPKGCAAIDVLMQSQPLYNYEASRLIENAHSEALRRMFTDIDGNDPTQVRGYLTGIIDALSDAMKKTLGDRLNLKAHEVKVLEAYSAAITRVFDNLARFSITDIGEGSLLSMLDRILGAEMLNMSGTPLSGMQIMGVLETRDLDFENVIVMSMNERMFPRRTRLRSMIPQQLRRAYGMPTAEDDEQEYAYYFFRLLMRSQRVVCTYDSRTSGLSSGAMSRYLLQIKYLGGDLDPVFRTISTKTHPGADRFISVPKSPDVMRRLQCFKCGNTSVALNLSASALKKYIKCPLMFYIDHVLQVRADNEPVPYMDAATYGNVIHKVLQDLFNETRPKGSTDAVLITEPVLIRMIADRGALLQRVYRKIDTEYHHERYQSRFSEMPSESLLLGEVMRDFIVRVIQKEIDRVKTDGPFTFIGSEWSKSTTQGDGMWKATPDNTVNVRFDIDRLDLEPDGRTLRFIDYKTGSDRAEIQSIEGLFGPDAKMHNEAAFQLLFYSVLYSEMLDRHCRIRPALYRLRVAFGNSSIRQHPFEQDGLYLGNEPDPLTWDGNPASASEWQAEFRQLLGDLIDRIFDDETPFEQTADIDNCRFCSYANVCRRITSDNDR